MTVQPQAPRRPRFSGAQRVQVAGNRLRIRVRLEFPKGTYVGVADGGSSPEEELRSAGEATLDALRQAIGEKDVVFELREVAVFDAFGKPGVMVSVSVEHEGQTRSLLGFSQRADTPAEAVAVAVLSATNRFLAVR